MEAPDTIRVGSVVSKDLADRIAALASKSERSTAAEIRLALRAWVASHEQRMDEAA